MSNAKPKVEELKDLPVSSKARSMLDRAIRTIKMVRPQCDECQQGDTVAVAWWRDCPHNPYFSKTQVKTTVPVVEDELDDDGNPTGAQIVVSQKERIEYKETPNITQVPLVERIGSGEAPERKRRLGFLMLEELGYKPACEFRNCTIQTIEVRDPQYGNFCCQEHYLYCKADAMGTIIEHGGRPENVRKRNEQLARLA